MAPAHGAATVDVTVTNNSGTSAVGVPDQFTLSRAHRRVGVTAKWNERGRRDVLVHGAHFQGTSAVTIDGSAAPLESVSRAGTTVTILTPAHSPGVAEVTVTTPGGTSNAKPYTYT